MRLKRYQIDAFAQKPFRGNPAAVVPLDQWLPDQLMQSLAAENNLSETAFFVRSAERFAIRWFTPTVEVDLCGHATLAAAHVIFNEMGHEEQVLNLDSKSGPLSVRRIGDRLQLDFPNRMPKPVPIPAGLSEALGCTILETALSRDLLVRVKDQQVVLAACPDFNALSRFEYFGVLLTADGSDCDFVSRCFFPKEGVPEDPVTGSAHCTLAPYWAEKKGLSNLFARQLSSRGGELWCEVCGDRVRIAGHSVKVMEGEIIL